MEKTVIKLVALDMDGTLLNSKKELPADFPSWVINHPSIRTVIASGRQYFRLEASFKGILNHLILIAENGSLVIADGKIIFSSPLSKENIRKTLDFIHQVPLTTPVLSGIKSAYYLRSEDEAKRDNMHMYYKVLKEAHSLDEVLSKDKIIKIAVYGPHSSIQKLGDNFSHLPEEINGVISDLHWADFANAGINKGRALIETMKTFKITPMEAMAFGDYGNDKEMLKSVYYSYAMENATPEIKNISNFHTDSNDNDGVMKILRKL